MITIGRAVLEGEEEKLEGRVNVVLFNSPLALDQQIARQSRGTPLPDYSSSPFPNVLKNSRKAYNSCNGLNDPFNLFVPILKKLSHLDPCKHLTYKVKKLFETLFIAVNVK